MRPTHVPTGVCTAPGGLQSPHGHRQDSAPRGLLTWELGWHSSEAVFLNLSTERLQLTFIVFPFVLLIYFTSSHFISFPFISYFPLFHFFSLYLVESSFCDMRASLKTSCFKKGAVTFGVSTLGFRRRAFLPPKWANKPLRDWRTEDQPRAQAVRVTSPTRWPLSCHSFSPGRPPPRPRCPFP